MRKAWVPFFDNGISSIIFIVALSSYDQLLTEESDVNRMVDAIELFNSIANNKLLEKISIILLLNKTDLFENKIKVSPINTHFPDFTLEQTFENGKMFFKEKFQAVLKPEKAFYSHFTTNTDRNLTGFVITAVISVVLDQNMQGMGMS